MIALNSPSWREITMENKEGRGGRMAEMATRNSILEKAKDIVANGNRERQYGSPEDSFNRIAGLWNAYLDGRKGELVITAEDVAVMMALLKIARIGGGHYTADSWVDLAGYAACGGEIASRRETLRAPCECGKETPSPRPEWPSELDFSWMTEPAQKEKPDD